jgi:hypothetical protein
MFYRLPEYFMGRRLLSRTLPLGYWQTNLARSSFAPAAGCTFAISGRKVTCLPNTYPPCVA